MTPKERVRAAMSGGRPDRVPVIPQICFPHAIRALGMDFESTVLEVIRNPELMNRLVLQCARQYGVDGVRAWMTPDPLDVVCVDGKWHGKDPETGKRMGLVDFMGGGWVVPSEESTLSTEEEVDRIPVLSKQEILRSGRLNGLKAIVDEAGEDLFVIGYPENFTVEHLTFERGKIQAMMDLIERPTFCHGVFEKALAGAVQSALAMAEVGVDAFMIADTFGGVISPSHFMEFCFPYMKRFVDALKGTGPLIYVHVCGNSSDILEMLADTGVDCIEPLDPLGGVSVADAKRRVGGRVALMGGVHTVKLASGSLQDVVDDCRRCLSEGAPGGGYILAAGDMWPTETSRDKVEAMIGAAKNYRYDR